MPDVATRSADAHRRALKQEYFDRYWIRRDFTRTDRRTMERTQLIWSHITRRRGTALDVGCGRGLFSSFLTEQGLVVDATDISPQAVELTAQRGINAYLLDLEEQAPLGVYDLIFCLEVLQQVRDPEAVLLRLLPALAEGGEIVVSVPNEFHVWRRLQVLLGGANFGGVEDSHLKFFTPARGEALLERVGLKVHTRLFPSIVPPQAYGLSLLGRAAAAVWPAGLAMSTILFAGKTS